jgi:cystinosin
MYCSLAVREEYQRRNSGQNNLIALNDVIFAVHATLVTFVFCLQVLFYRKSNEGPSNIGTALAIALTILITSGAFLSYGGLIQMLDYLYALSYIKLILTVVKCVPQVWLNWVRRSTIGWSIANVLLDFFGGFFSISQLFIDAYTSGHNIDGIIGALPKFILGIISIIFDIIFMMQHYLWFPEDEGPHSRTVFGPDELEPTTDGKQAQVAQ